jgi:MinD-like ATPase involved in chromosome partitioning or flagellar assembly
MGRRRLARDRHNAAGRRLVTVISIGTWRGLGATTSALMLAAGAASAEPTWMIEADPAGGVLQARSTLLAGATKTLEHVAFEHDCKVDAAAQPLAGTNVVIGPADSFRAWSSIASPRTNWIDQLRRVSGTVIIDIGSLRGSTPVWRIIEQSDVVLMCTTSEPASLVSTLAWMDAKGQSAPGVGGLSASSARLVVVDAPTGSGERFTSSQVQHEIGDRLAGWLPWQPTVVDAILRGATVSHRRLRGQLLTSAARATMAKVTEGVRR